MLDMRIGARNLALPFQRQQRLLVHVHVTSADAPVTSQDVHASLFSSLLSPALFRPLLCLPLQDPPSGSCGYFLRFLHAAAVEVRV
eukprot:355701-Chlamydomonas_euryale.AAC.1